MNNEQFKKFLATFSPYFNTISPAAWEALIAEGKERAEAVGPCGAVEWPLFDWQAHVVAISGYAQAATARWRAATAMPV